MFAVVLSFLNLFGVIECDNLYIQSQEELEINKVKVQLIGAYNQVLRWRRYSEDIDWFPDMSIVQFIGGDYHLLDTHLTDITEMAGELEFYLDTIDEVPMKYKASARYYSFLSDKLSKYLPEERRETCASWFSSVKLVSDKNNLFDYVNEPSNKQKPAGKLISKYFKNSKNERQFQKKLGDVIEKGKLAGILKEVFDMGREYLNSSFVEDPEGICASGLTDFIVLFELEDKLQDKLTDRDNDCPQGMLNAEMNMSFASALKNLDELLVDGELVNYVLAEADANKILTQYKYLKRVSQNPLSLLSLASVRDMVTGILSVGECNKCNCKMVNKVHKLKKSLQRIRNILPSRGGQCIDSWKEVVTDATSEFTAIEKLRQSKDSLLSIIEHIQGIDDVFEIFSTNLESYFRKPYIGIQYTDMPTKHGLWWLATHLMSYKSCQEFTQVQIIRALLEKYSVAYYTVDINAFNQCKLLPTVDTEDSVIMADQMKAMKLYDMYRKFNFEDLSKALNYGNRIRSVTENAYELTLWLTFNTLAKKELSLDPDDYETEIQTFMEFSVLGEQNKRIEMDTFGQTHTLMEKCGSCEIYYIQKTITELTMNQLMNYDDGRIYPISYEKDIFTKQFSQIIERDHDALSQCQDSINDQLDLYKESTHAVLSSNMMKDHDVFQKYLTYVGMTGMKLTPQMIIKGLDHITDISKFYSSVAMRLERRGLRSLYYIVLY